MYITALRSAIANMRIPDRIKREIRDCRKKGMTYWDIAAYLSMSISTVRLICNPNIKITQKKSYEKYREKRLETMKKYAKAHRAKKEVPDVETL